MGHEATKISFYKETETTPNTAPTGTQKKVIQVGHDQRSEAPVGAQMSNLSARKSCSQINGRTKNSAENSALYIWVSFVM